MSKSRKPLGTKLNIAETTPISVGGLTSINGIEISADTMDVTDLDCLDGYREFEQGFKDGGEVSIEGLLDVEEENGQGKLLDYLNSGEKVPFEIVFPPKLGAKWEFNGIVIGFATNVSLEDPLSFSATIKVSGKPTLTIGTGS